MERDGAPLAEGRVGAQWSDRSSCACRSPGSVTSRRSRRHRLSIADTLNQLGLEVEEIDEPGREINGVVVAKILDVVPHPDADRIRLADVDFGDGQLRVVCGAPNIHPGMVAPFARVGAVLPGDFKIERRKIRGVVSEGMLASRARARTRRRPLRHPRVAARRAARRGCARGARARRRRVRPFDHARTAPTRWASPVSLGRSRRTSGCRSR